MKNKIQQFLIILILTLIYNPATAQNHSNEEMRGVWVATAKNIDFPTNKYLTTAEQKKEFIEMVNLFQSLNINAIMFQVRPAADAFFPSKYEPWSEWLTGKQGQAPDPYYDPLKFMIAECHKRNIEFHAWINPFRAVANIETADIAPNHISKRRPEWFFTYDINTYFNPGIPEVRNYINNVVCDIARRYNIDGVHFDDYFYPYPKRGENGSFIPVPDSKTFIKYGTGFSDVKDWRRNNMDIFIRSINDSLKAIKPTLKFGIAPSGVWRNKSKDPKGSDTRGFAHYDYLYADVLKWLHNEWIDYVAPQLYWSIGHKYADYNTLVEWWSKNSYDRHLYIGHGVYMAKEDAADLNWRNPRQLPEQIRILRKNKKVSGSIFYKASALKRNAMGFNDSLKVDFYADAAVTPKMDWLQLPEVDTVIVVVTDTAVVDTVLYTDAMAPPPPTDISTIPFGKKVILSWQAPEVSGVHPDDGAEYYKVYRIDGDRLIEPSPLNFREIRSETFYTIERRPYAIFRKRYTYIVTAVDKAGNESEAGSAVRLKLKLRE